MVIVMPRKATRSAQGAGGIYKRADGRWEGKYTLGRDPGTGKQIRRSVYGKTQKEVTQKLQKALTAISEGTYMEPSKMTVGQWLNVWIEDYCVDVKPRTLDKYRSTIKNRLIPYLGKMKLSALSTHHIQHVYNGLWRGEEGFNQLSPKSIRDTHGTLHRALEQAVELNYIRTNPSDRCKLPRVEKAEIKALETKQLSAFLKAIEGNRYERLFAVDLFTGLRMGEILALSWDCIDFKKGTLRVYRQLHQVKGQYIYGSLKNDKPRSLMLAQVVLDQLRRQRAEQRRWKLAAGSAWMNDDDLVFTDEIGRHLSPNTVRSALHRVTDPMGLEGFRFHDLRHSYAVASLQAGDDLKTLQSNLGHHTAAFTMEVYGHVTESMQQASARRMDSFVSSLSKGGFRTIPGTLKGSRPKASSAKSSSVVIAL